MIPATHDFSVVRGTSGPTQGLKVRLKANTGTEEVPVLVNVSFEDVRLSIYQRSTLLFRGSVSSGHLIVTDVAEAEITWIPTPDETRLIPFTKDGATPKARYELEVWNAGTQLVYLLGKITGIGGINDDEEVS